MGKTATGMAESVPTPSKKKQPICVLVIGMAGSGKTNVVKRLKDHFIKTDKSYQLVNLDPAVKHVPYIKDKCMIDIRDSVKFKTVMKKYELGPNGGIVTSLNLFAGMFDQV